MKIHTRPSRNAPKWKDTMSHSQIMPYVVESVSSVSPKTGHLNGAQILVAGGIFAGIIFTICIGVCVYAAIKDRKHR